MFSQPLCSRASNISERGEPNKANRCGERRPADWMETETVDLTDPDPARWACFVTRLQVGGAMSRAKPRTPRSAGGLYLSFPGLGDEGGVTTPSRGGARRA